MARKHVVYAIIVVLWIILVVVLFPGREKSVNKKTVVSMPSMTTVPSKFKRNDLPDIEKDDFAVLETLHIPFFVFFFAPWYILCFYVLLFL